MTREEVKEMLPVLQAFADGKTIESRYIKGDMSLWYDDEDPSFDNDLEYRIKSEPKYRSFANAEECWAEMQKHKPFGWVKSKDGSTINKFMFIDSLNNDEVTIRTSVRFTYSELVKYYIFADGTPFGVKVKE